MRASGRMWGGTMFRVLGLALLTSGLAGGVCFSGDPIQAVYTEAILDAADGALYVQASVQVPALQAVAFRYSGSDCQVVCNEDGCSAVGSSKNNHLSGMVMASPHSGEVSYITAVPTDRLAACGFAPLPGTNVSNVFEATLCAEVASWECEALDLASKGTSCTKVRVSMPKALASSFPSQPLGRYTVEQVAVVTDGNAPSNEGGYPTTVILTVLSPSAYTVDGVDVESIIEWSSNQDFAIVSPIKSMGSPVRCTAYTDEGMCRQTFSFQVYVGAGSELCDIRDGFKLTLNGRCQPELGECGTDANTEAVAFALNLPRLCAPVSHTPSAPKMPTLALGPPAPESPAMSEVVLAQGEPAETTVSAVVVSPNERLCARFNITVPREVKDSDARLLTRYRVSEVMIAAAHTGSMKIDATAWMTNYKEELFLGASSAGGKVWSASFCVPMVADSLPDMPVTAGASQAYTLRATVSWSPSDNTTALVHARRSLKRWSPMRPSPPPEGPPAIAEGGGEGWFGEPARASLSEGGAQRVWTYIVTHTRELLMSAFLPSPPPGAEAGGEGREGEEEVSVRLLGSGGGNASALAPSANTTAPAAPSAVGPGSAFLGVTTEALGASGVFVLAVPAAPASSSTSTSTAAGGKKRAWTIPTSAIIPASDREKATSGSKSVSDPAAFSIAVGVLFGGVLVGVAISAVLKKIPNRPRHPVPGR